jgi:hypothetical protein
MRPPRALPFLLLLAVPAAAASDRSEPLVLRAPDGRLALTVAPTLEPIRLDGALDDAVWRKAPPVEGFVQSEPKEGELATEPTQVWVAHDAEGLYIAAYCHDSAPPVVNNIRKDFPSGDQDSFEVILDTFADRRNGFVFMTTPEGARSDQQVTNEGKEVNASWDAVWTVKTQRVADGWTLEMAIPWRSLRFERGPQQPWGINFSRRIRRKNEVDFWSPVPRAYTLSRVSLAGELTGLPPLTPGRNLRVKPYVLAETVRPLGAEAFEPDAAFGLDLKYGVKPSLTLDLTANPDFAQAEADEQQVNLTQFSLFYPEKRDFFLENSGIFYVGDAARNNRLNPTPTPDEDLLLFFSRRIGLTDSGESIPVLAGGRLTGRAAGLSLGLLSVQTRATGSEPANHFAVARVRRNLFGHSDVGALLMTRQNTDDWGDFNRVYGLDANLRFFGQLDWSSYAAKTQSPGKQGKDYAVRSSLNREGNSFHGKLGVLQIGENFRNDLGYYRRLGVRKWFMDVGARPRPASLQRKGVREMHPHMTWDYYEDTSGQLRAKNFHNGYTCFLQNGGYVELSVNPRFERIDDPFTIQKGAQPIPSGSYGWTEYWLRGQSDPSRAVSLEALAVAGGLWSGRQKSITATLTFRPSYRFKLAAGAQRTDASLDLPRIDFVTSLLTARTNYSFNTNMFLDALVQYDSGQKAFNANLRFNLIHRPLSDLFVVYNEQRISRPDEPTPGRAVIVKFTRMVSF